MGGEVLVSWLRASAAQLMKWTFHFRSMWERPPWRSSEWVWAMNQLQLVQSPAWEVRDKRG